MKNFPRVRVVIWGLQNTRHSHRYIHKGFYDTLRRSSIEVLWLDDCEKSREFIRSGDFVIAAGVACKFLPVNPKVYYVLHNVDNPNFQEVKTKINLQVFTNDSKGKMVDESIALWDMQTKTLYQPWGLPEPKNYWLNPSELKSKYENWIGAIWDNDLHQGNRVQLEKYISALKSKNIRFKRLGGTRSITKDGLSSKKSFKKVNQSPIGAAIVGQWQVTNGYVPCRAFKNVAAGAIPISNSDMTHIFGHDYLHIPDIEELVEVSLGISLNQINMKSRSCKEMLEAYSYERALSRMANLAL